MTTATANTTHTTALLALRRRASVRTDAGAVALIDAALADDADAMLRARVGDVSLTARQWEVLRLIDEYIRDYVYAPTFQEIADVFRVSRVTVHEYLHALVRKGVLAMDKHKARSMRIVERK